MMYIKRTIVFFLTLFPTMALKAQFYTIRKDTVNIAMLDKNSVIYNNSSEKQIADTIIKKQQGKSTADSILIGLLRQRISICMPLDFIHLNSRYGYRKDPITRCSKFHDGIDLRCDHANVYSMLDGVVKNVVYSNFGYGNYITIDYGKICCLYGHLSVLFLKKGQHVDAGMVIGISGSSGKSTGPHLHLQLSHNSNHIDPYYFILFLKGFIEKINKEIVLYN